MDYVVFKTVAEGNAAHFGRMENFEDDFELEESIPLAASFPPEAAFRMSPDFPDQLELHDFIRTIGGHVVLSARVRDFLEREGVEEVEFLPIRLINHKGRTIKAEYYVLNVLRAIDCIDQTQTNFEWDSLDPELMDNVSNLTLDSSRIGAKEKIFRLRFLNRFVVLSRSLAKAMTDAGFRGFKTVEISEITR